MSGFEILQAEPVPARDRRRGRRRTRSRPTAGRGFAARRTGPSAVAACVIRYGCSIRLSTPPRLSASVHTFVRATRATASSSDSTRNETMPPKSRIWRGGDLVPRVIGQARVEHLRDVRVILEEGDDGAGVLAVLAHPDGERLQPPEHEPRIERSRHGAERLLQEAEALGDHGVVRAREAPDDVGVPTEVLGRRMQRRCRRRARAAAGGRASRRCCRRRAARRRRGRHRPRPGCRRCSAAGSSATRSRRAESVRRDAPPGSSRPRPA